MSEQTGGAKIDEIHTLATNGLASLVQNELLPTAQVAKQLVNDIKGNSDSRVNALAKQLNKDADKLIEILGGAASSSSSSSSGFFSGFLGSKTSTPAPPSTSTPAPPSITTPAPPSITTPAPPSITTTPAPKKTYESTFNRVRGINSAQRLDLNVSEALAEDLSRTLPSKPESKSSLLPVWNKMKASFDTLTKAKAELRKVPLPTVDTERKQTLLADINEYKASVADYLTKEKGQIATPTSPVSKKTEEVQPTSTTSKANIKKLTAVPPENVEPNSSTFSFINPLRKTRKAQPTSTTSNANVRKLTAVPPENVEPNSSTFSFNNPLSKTRKAQASTPTTALPQSSSKDSRLGEKQTGKRNLSKYNGIELPTLRPSGPPPPSSRPRLSQEPTQTRPESSFIIPTVNNAPPLNVSVKNRAKTLGPKLYPTTASDPEGRKSPTQIKQERAKAIAANREKRKESFEQEPVSLQANNGTIRRGPYQELRRGGQRNTRKYSSKKQAQRQTRRG